MLDHGRDLDLETVSRLRLAVMRLARRLRQQAEPGVTPSMLSALASIERLGPVALGDLAEAERVQPPTLTQIVRRLEQDGLVTRASDDVDRRIARVSLTAQGRRFIERARSKKDAYLAARMRDLPADGVAALTAAVVALERILDEDDG